MAILVHVKKIQNAAAARGQKITTVLVTLSNMLEFRQKKNNMIFASQTRNTFSEKGQRWKYFYLQHFMAQKHY